MQGGEPKDSIKTKQNTVERKSLSPEGKACKLTAPQRPGLVM